VSGGEWSVTYRVGIDVGGTFTDFLLVADGTRVTHKTASTPSDPAEAVINGLGEIARLLGQSLPGFTAGIDLMVHGTTVATNALLTRQGARSGLLCTGGFRDVLPLRDGTREEAYDNRLPVPTPLVPRHLRLGVGERLDYSGQVLQPLDEAAVRQAATAFRGAGVEALSVCFMHSPTNPRHERLAAEILREELPGVRLTVSSELLPQLGYFDRTSTTVLNSYVAPIMARYVASLTGRLAAAGFGGTLLLVQSNGGVATPEEFSGRAVLSLLSGPASGPVAAVEALAPLEARDCITVDMGGTSFDSAVVKDGRPLVMTDGWVDRWRLALPMIDIHTIGAGGGSVAYVTSGGLLRVGPFSAGADPGPACYGRGGERATVTDADLLLGYLAPGSFLGGKMALDARAAARALERDVGAPLGLDLTEAAAGVYDVVNVNMMAGIEEVTLNRGLDPRDFPLVVAGGAGPVHAAAIARELGIPLLVVPRESSILCAAGMLLCDFRHDFVRSCKALLREIPARDLRALWSSMRREGVDALRREGLAERDARLLPSLDMRYRGQWYELNVPVDASTWRRPSREAIRAAFDRMYETLFGYATKEMPVEVLNVRLSVIGSTAKPGVDVRATAPTDAMPAPLGSRPVWSASNRALVPTPVYDGGRLGPGARLGGPAVIELTTTTIVVPDEFDAVVDPLGSFVLYLRTRADLLPPALLEGAGAARAAGFAAPSPRAPAPSARPPAAEPARP
jgi:N-methylhydantoinase A